MNDALKLLIVVIVFSVVMAIVKKYSSSKLEKQLIQLLADKDYKGFDELINSKKVKNSIPPFNVDFMKLNVAILKEDKNEIDRMFESFDYVRPNKAQKEAVYVKGFYYYLSNEKYDKVEKYYKLLAELKSQESMYEFDRAYDVYVNKGCRYLEETIAELNTAPDYYKPALAGLISSMYENRKDEKMAKKYADKVLEHLEKMK